MSPRYAARVDENQQEIVTALRMAGVPVLLLHMVGSGCPDVLASAWRTCPGCGRRERHNLLMELKNGNLSPSRQKLTPMEADFHRDWPGPVVVAATMDEALRLAGVEAAL